MVIKSVELEIVCGITSKLPDTDKPEVAFAGKSNVGKSSLINGLMNRKSLARTSSQPGKTQTINYYNINDKMYFVDLPGYGYTNAPPKEKEKWGKMIENYLHTSGQLKAVFLLIDIRHEPSANDRQMYEWIVYHGFDPIVIATKLDKIKRSQVQKHVKMIRDGLNMKPGSQIFPYSSMTKQGRDEIWGFIDEMLGFSEKFKEGLTGKTAVSRKEKENLSKFPESEGNPAKEIGNQAKGNPEEEGNPAKIKIRKKHVKKQEKKQEKKSGKKREKKRGKK